MARIHAINLYPRPNHSGKGQSLRITSGQPGAGPEGQAPALSSAQQHAERKERQRVLEGAPGHVVAQGLPPVPIKATPIKVPPPFRREQILHRLREATRRKGPR